MFLRKSVLKTCSKFTGEHPYRSVISIKLLFLRKGVLKICSKFTGKQPCRSAISIKLQSNWTAASVSDTFLQGFFPFLFIGSAARAFETLKKKYRKRINFQKSSRSGSFLHWLDSFIRPPKTKTNKPEPSVEINESSNAGDELKNNGYDSEESEDAGFDVMTVSPSYWQRSGNQLH